MGFLAALLWSVFVNLGAWEAVGLPALEFWPGLVVTFLGVFFIGAVSRD
ncbi:membrane protein [Arthrobacter phage Berrie]|uniref:Membrane protein n=1 Tax=Arthrobacter phage Berrie TaxID=2926087 RepID=A0ABZ2CRL5_9CAUD